VFYKGNVFLTNEGASGAIIGFIKTTPMHLHALVRADREGDFFIC